MNFIKKAGILTTTFVMVSTLALPVANEKVNIKTGIQNKTVEAASGWKKIKTKTGNTAGKNLATKMTAEAILGIVGWGIAGGPGTAAAVGAFQPVKDTAFSKLKTVYYTDKIYQRKTLQGPEFKHVITFYKNKAKTKKIGTANVIQKTVVKGEIAKKQN